MIRAYLNIQKIRMGDRLNFSLEIPDNAHCVYSVDIQACLSYTSSREKERSEMTYFFKVSSFIDAWFYWVNFCPSSLRVNIFQAKGSPPLF